MTTPIETSAETAPERVDAADHLVARRHRRTSGCEVALDQVQVGAAHPAATDPHPHLTRPGLRLVPLDPAQRATAGG